ncbi:MAG: DUF3098 domain-containing protein [Chloroherpetonaceae bacterium]|nr:DUF3098 domain-containing protein [Chloroherpetonaceae bacterium]MDW8437102.1 DUF3098 domain-containing protein [Chloroherpetonaceae bacterium]
MPKAIERKKDRDRKKSLPSRPKRELVFETMPLQKENYVLIAVGFAIILLGYALIGFESEVDGFLSLNVSPPLVIGGFVWIIYAILHKPKPNDRHNGAF